MLPKNFLTVQKLSLLTLEAIELILPLKMVHNTV